MEQSNQIICPECEKPFTDMRGLTSHARHKHDLSRDELIEIMNDPEDDSSNEFLKIIGGAGTVLLVLITLGKMR